MSVRVPEWGLETTAEAAVVRRRPDGFTAVVYPDGARLVFS